MKYLKKRLAQDQGFIDLAKISAKENIIPENVALRVVKNRRPEIEKYLNNFGVTPSKNDAALAVQATLIHEGRIADKQAAGVPAYTDAENSVFQDEIESEDNGVQSFIGGSLLASISKAGKAGIDAINKKRIANGHKPILSGKGWQNLAAKVDKIKVKVDDNGFDVSGKLTPPPQKTEAEKTGLDKAIEAVTGSFTDDAKKAYIKKNIPFIIGGLILVVVAIIYLRKKK